MRSLPKKVIRLLPLIFILLLSIVTPAAASINQIVITESTLLTAEKGFYTESLQSVLEKISSPLSSYSETLSGGASTAAGIIWMGSQSKEYGINPKVLLVTLKILGRLDGKPASPFTPFVQEMTDKIWEGYSAYLSGTRSVKLANGSEVQVSSSNSATFALAYYLGPSAASESALVDLLVQWKTVYQEIFLADPSVDKPDSVPHAISGVKPFMQLPFAQPESGYIAVNSFFDHAVPGTYDDSILRFDGQTVTNASFSTCNLGVSCYGGHNGIDYKTGAGMPILAAADGVVVYKYYNTDASAGRVDSGLYIDHNNNFRTAYWHMDPIAVEYGQTVKAGDLIGYSGNIGNSSGAHLHFGLRLVAENKSIDPFGWWSTAVSDYWGSSEWMWNSDLIADMGEAQTQLFYTNYWWKVDSGYNGNSFWTYEMSKTASSTNWGIWGTYIDTPGKYNVYAYWPKDSANSQHARYKIFHSTGTNTVIANQANGGDQFTLLGSYTFNTGPAAVVMNDYTGYSGGKLRFDAVKWELQTSATPTPTESPLPTVTGTPEATATPDGTATPVPTNTPTPTSTSVETERVNLALGKPASQSSLYGSDPVKGRPHLAVDGNPDGVYDNSSVTHTQSNTTAWWQVDLQAVQNISQIVIWNRTDCCYTRLANFYILVSDTPFASTSLVETLKQTGIGAFYFSGTASRAPIPVDVNRSGRYVRVQLSGKDYLSLAEVQILSYGSSAPDPNTSTPTPTAPTGTGTPEATPTGTATPEPTSSATSPAAERVNLALGKPASQSSLYGSDPVKGRPRLAADGNTDGNYAHSSVTHTKSNQWSWWQVDLGSVQDISQITVWNRTDCCTTRLSNFYVFVSDVPFTSTGLNATLGQSGVGSYYFKGAAPRTTSFDINRTGRYVRIQLSGTNYLSLAEVQIWSPGSEVMPTPLVATPVPGATFEKQTDYPYYVPNFAHPDKADNWFGVAGQVFNENGIPLSQIKVVVKGKLNGVAIEKSTQTGLINDYGPGGFEIVLGTAPIATSGNLNITLYSLSGQPISSPVYFTTYADVLKNLVIINFTKK